MKIFGQRLKMRREQIGVTQKELASKVGIATTSLSAYENGRKPPTIDNAYKLAETLDVSLDWLCGGHEPNTGKEPETMADVIRFFAGMSDRLWYISLKCEQIPLGNEPCVSDEDVGAFEETNMAPSGDIYYSTNQNCAVFRARYNPISRFFDDWHQMNKLYRDGVLKPSLYREWINDQIEKNRDVKLPEVRT